MRSIIRNVATNALKPIAANQNAMRLDPHQLSATYRAWLRVVGITLLLVSTACQAGNSTPGQQIAFETERNGDFIYVMNADGTEQTRLTLSPLVQDAHPTWSPDGKQIAFASNRDGNYEIYLMNADGTAPIRLTNSPGLDYGPAWSPDGKQIAFVTARDDPAPDKCGGRCNTEIYIINSDGSGLSRLTNNPADDLAPAWKP